ncbi:MAG: hypothetical protein ACFFDT_32005 [Candidatus Hodarchaeota archaeon]
MGRNAAKLNHMDEILGGIKANDLIDSGGGGFDDTEVGASFNEDVEVKPLLSHPYIPYIFLL